MYIVEREVFFFLRAVPLLSMRADAAAPAKKSRYERGIPNWRFVEFEMDGGEGIGGSRRT